MKKRTCGFYLVLTALFALAQGILPAQDAAPKDKVLGNLLASDPGFKTENGDKYITASLAIPSTSDKSFAIDYDMKITTFNHYAMVTVEFKNSKNGQRLFMRWNKPDDAIARGLFDCELAPGLTATGKPLEKMGPALYKYSIEYQAPKRAVQFRVADASGKEIYNSGWLKVGGRFSVDQFSIRAEDRAGGLSDVSYDADDHSVFFRSVVGNEGAYAYAFEGNMSNLKIRYMAE